MNNRLKSRISGLREPMIEFADLLYSGQTNQPDLHNLNKAIMKEMKALNFDKIQTDEVGNIIGIIDGYKKEGDIVLLCTIDLNSDKSKGEVGEIDPSGSRNYKPGIITSLFTAALLKRSMAAMNGDLIVVCVPRQQTCDFGIQYLFDNFLASRKIKGIILAEPTDFNICLGNKGRMEYEIIVEGCPDEGNAYPAGYGMMSTMFPLIRELEEVAKKLPKNCDLGSSMLRIKDISFGSSGTASGKKELHVLVDRTYIPEETSQAIIDRAAGIAQNVYKDQPSASATAVLTKNRVKTISGKELFLRNQYAPWKMESHNPFALGSIEVLRENGMSASIQYWQKIITEGSFTHGKLGIPTIGFGAGTEGEELVIGKNISYDDLLKSALGKALIVYRTIGFPTFGWSDDEI